MYIPGKYILASVVRLLDVEIHVLSHKKLQVHIHMFRARTYASMCPGSNATTPLFTTQDNGFRFIRGI